jgi:hypothetical protein
MEAKHTVLIDEAGLVLRFFGYLTSRKGIPKEPPRKVLGMIEERIEAERVAGEIHHDEAALMMATEMTRMAMHWLTDTMNEQAIAAGEGEVARKISKEEARQ